MPALPYHHPAMKVMAWVAVICAYFLAGKLSLGFASLHVSASPVWLPAGMAVALFLLLGFSIWPAIFIGAFLVNITTAGDMLTSASIAVGNTLEGIFGAWLLQKFAHGVHAFESPPDILKSALLAGLLSPTVSATIGITSLTIGHYALPNEYAIIWLTWWMGDATGILIVTPAILLWAQRPRIEWNSRERFELGLLLFVLLVTCEGIFGPFIHTKHKYPLQFVLVPVLIWAAFRFGPRETATLTVLLAGWATWGTINGRGPFTTDSENEALLLGQAFLAVTTVMALALAAAVQERKDAELRFQDTAERLVNKRTAELLHTQARLRTMAQALTLTEQRERKRMATELHDYLAQLLVLGKMKLSQTHAQIRKIGGPVASVLEEIDQTLDKALDYTRTLIAELSPPVLHEFGLPMALKWLADQMKKHRLTVDVRLGTSELPLTENQAILLFHSARELLINVAKHAGTNKASLMLDLAENVLTIAVQDQGKGFKTGALEPHQPGQHFGLFSIKERMEELGGWLRVESTPGQGTTITLGLPFTSTAAPSTDTSVHERPVHPPPAKAAGARRVLLVDDHAMVRQGLRAVLEAHPDLFIIGEAADGREAVSIAKKRTPDVIVMDINMPRMDGIEATKRIKKDQPGVVIIAVSVNDTPDLRESLQRAGASAFVSKAEAGERLYETIMAIGPLANSRDDTR
ncbi:MAG TPA: MASE1 domain-containing protein [Nitrospira sp.]|nr:MASE1 domain-containing protein [Nitrospira sp.]